ncbi:hypothetical protein TIFTF001_047337 [Ficus carica]|uniref:Uncharacterized protein n=1 Tax=Ficus carica TaxID=3494 RepID=A0AA87YSQ2_FICCA|nr:hypothetical protein TIFTF001_047337 [Ficus carica]
MLLNLVAYEMCFPCSNSSQSPLTDKDPWITSYVNLLDFLIDNEQDVKDLRASDILRNCLSSDDDVAKMINDIGSCCFAPSRDTYACAKKKIQKHYRRKCAIWMTQMCDAYFSSPWTILALLAATLMLVFTGIQALKKE